LGGKLLKRKENEAISNGQVQLNATEIALPVLVQEKKEEKLTVHSNQIVIDLVDDGKRCSRV